MDKAAGFAVVGVWCALLVMHGGAVAPALADIGIRENGIHTVIKQKLPAGSWAKAGRGVCLVGIAPHVVFDPAFPNALEALEKDGTIGAQLCDWLDDRLRRHRAVSEHVLNQPKGLMKFFKQPSFFRFEDHMEATITYMDLLHYEESPGRRGRVPTPWISVKFTYRPPTARHGERIVDFVVDSDDESSTTEVTVLLNPENAALLEEHAQKLDRTDVEELKGGQPIGESSVVPTVHELLVPLRTFIREVGGKCVFYDGRMYTMDENVCNWAISWKNLYPASSAILSLHKISMFRSGPSGFEASIKMINPEYSRKWRSFVVMIKPDAELARRLELRYEALARIYSRWRGGIASDQTHQEVWSGNSSPLN